MIVSVCIPTYNRAEFLPALLDSLLPYKEKVEIAISDNASTDNTAAVLSNYKKIFPHFHYNIAPENKGPDRNYFAAAAMATAPYLMLCGSDDAIEPKGFEKALQMLSQNQPTLLVAERLNCDNNLKPINHSRFLNLENDRIFPLTSTENMIEYFRYGRSIGAVYSYLSNTIISRKAWEEANFDESFMGSAYPHVYKFLQIMQMENATLFYQHQPMVLTRLFNDSFLTHDYAKRALLDVEGYSRLAKACFTQKPAAATALLNILKAEILNTHFARILRFSLIKSHSKPENWQAYFSAACQTITMPTVFLWLNQLPIFTHHMVVKAYSFVKKFK